MIPPGDSVVSESRARDEEEAGAALRTIECLRARLVAERQASRAAEDRAWLMSHMLVELEKQLKQETRQRDRTQRRLQVLGRKLESVRSRESERSSGSESCSVSLCAGSSASPASTSPSSFARSPEEERGERTKAQFKINSPETTPFLVSKAPDPSLTNVGTSRGDGYPPDREGEDEEAGVDNTLAIVLATIIPDKETAREAEGAFDNDVQVREALEALRVAKASIQRAMRQKRRTGRVMKVANRVVVPPPHPCAPQLC